MDHDDKSSDGVKLLPKEWLMVLHLGVDMTKLFVVSPVTHTIRATKNFPFYLHILQLKQQLQYVKVKLRHWRI